MIALAESAESNTVTPAGDMTDRVIAMLRRLAVLEPDRTLGPGGQLATLANRLVVGAAPMPDSWRR
jgi:hypothetical protein